MPDSAAAPIGVFDLEIGEQLAGDVDAAWEQTSRSDRDRPP
ncbi:MAG: hypothetical protein ACK583_16080 [Cyanobacteriota bacterium]